MVGLCLHFREPVRVGRLSVSDLYLTVETSPDWGRRSQRGASWDRTFGLAAAERLRRLIFLWATNSYKAVRSRWSHDQRRAARPILRSCAL